MPAPSGAGGFADLAPDVVMDRVERAAGRRASGVCRPLASYINRVYEIGLEDGGFLVAKFYRPGRWSRAALQDEHDFLRELAAAEIPVVAPLADGAGQTLHEEAGIAFAVFPRLGGRPCDEPARLGLTNTGNPSTAIRCRTSDGLAAHCAALTSTNRPTSRPSACMWCLKLTLSIVKALASTPEPT